MPEEIDIRRRNGIAHVALNRPSVKNAVTLAMWRELAEIFSCFAADRDLRAVVLSGKGKDFSVGADISEFDKIRNDRQQSAEYEVAVDACSGAIAGLGKPVVAAISGYCLGGGCHLALACDFRFAERTRRSGDSGGEAFDRLWRSQHPAAVGAGRCRERQTDSVLGRSLSRRAGKVDGTGRRDT